MNWKKLQKQLMNIKVNILLKLIWRWIINVSKTYRGTIKYVITKWSRVKNVIRIPWKSFKWDWWPKG